MGRGPGTAANPVPFGALAGLPVANRPLLGHAVDALAAAGIAEIAIVAEPEATDQVRAIVDRNGIDKRIARLAVYEQEANTGLKEVLKAAEPLLAGDAFVLHLGDALCWDYDSAISQSRIGAKDSVVLVQQRDRYGSSPQTVDPILVDGSTSRFGHLGIYVVGGAFPELVPRLPQQPGLSAQARAAINLLNEEGGRTVHWRAQRSWRYDHSADSLIRANRLALGRLEPARVPDHVTDTDIEGVVSIDPSATVESSTLRGPLIIGAGARITDSYLGPFTAVDQGAEIEAAELEHSVILAGASVRHLGNRLEASVVGPRAQVFREFRLPRALRLDVGADARISFS